MMINIDKTQVRQINYFEMMAWFENPDNAAETAADLAAAGYIFEQTPYVFDEYNGILLTSIVYGVISGHTTLDSNALFDRLREIVGPYGSCDSLGFLDAPRTQVERCHHWTGGSSIAERFEDSARNSRRAVAATGT
jgi:hypothetical protein